MIKKKNKLFILLMLLSAVFTLDAHDFMHKHDGADNSHCYSCLISSSLITEETNSGEDLLINPSPEIIFNINYSSELSESFSLSDSERAPPAA